MTTSNSAFPLSRRHWLRSATVGTIAWRSGSWLSALADEVAPIVGPQRSCILLWMSGGPSQIDTFDPKPGHANGGPFQAIDTVVPGIQIAEHLPQLAQQMEQMALIRSMTSKEGDHERATYFVQTGYLPGGPLKYPALGATTSRERRAEESDLPRFVSIAPAFFGRNIGAGFLGPRYAPLVVGASGYAGPGSEDLQVSNLKPGGNVNPDRLAGRLSILEDVEREFQLDEPDPVVESHRTAYQQALRMMQGRAGEVFDLSKEPAELRDAYGRNTFGQGCLLARRLVESGVPFVDVSLSNVPGTNIFGWDTHVDNFESTRKLCGILDPAFATLLKDLQNRGLLDRTVIAWMGEFGRTPKINSSNGRDHYPNAWTTVLAGGGIRGGQVIGKTSPDGRVVAERAVRVPDLLATVCRALGVDGSKQNMSNLGRPIRVVDPSAQPIVEALS